MRRAPSPPELAIVLVLVLATWAIPSAQPQPGLDGSWGIGLDLGLARGLEFGRELIFTYGPLGLTSGPRAVTGGTFALALALAVVLHGLLAALLYGCLRRVASRLVAFVMTLVVAAIVIGNGVGS